MAELFDYLGFSEQHLDAMHAGDAVFHGMDRLERLEEDVAAAGVVMLVRRQATSEVIDQFLDTEVFRQIHDLYRHDVAESIEAFDDFVFRDARVLRSLARDPGGTFNLSAGETTLFSEIPRTGDEALQVASQSFRSVLAKRYTAYTENGLEGIADYVRANGQTVSPADEIRSGLEGLSALHGDFRDFFAAVGSSADGLLPEGTERRLHWVEKDVNDEVVVGLLEQHIGRFADSGVAVELHYYASAVYNSMVTVVAAVPHREQTLVFAINHTYTDQVMGIGSSLRRRIARNLAADALSRHLQQVRERVHAMP